LEAELWAASRLPSGEPPPAPVAETAPPPAAPAGPDEVKESDDPLKDIGELTAEQLFVALRAENPRTIGIVLHQVPPEKAAEVLTKLSPNLRRATFVEMAKGVPNNPELVARLIRAVVQSCDEMEHSTTGTRVFRTLAEMLHSVQREDRGAMMEALQESDSHAAERVDDLLFNFEDLIQIEDRTLQRILGEIDTRVLAEALYGASDALSKKVMMNRSARVQKMITEEMEVMGAVSPEANYQARRKVVEVIRKFDREGHLHWVE
jgi:flagellar motor switch protein FliG